MNNINDLEYRLWLLQGEVNQAMQNAGRADFTYLNRLNHMESEIRYLQQQITELKKAGQGVVRPLNQPLPSVQPLPFVQPLPSGRPQSFVQPLPSVQPQLSGNPLPSSQPQSAGQPLPFGQSQPFAQPLPSGQPFSSGNPGKKDLEKTWGTGVMGIVASVLIFISIIIFGGLLLPYLTNIIMTAVMFLLSFVLFGAGYWLLRKNPKNKFHISLCACGVTAICVSLFVTRLYFALINDAAFLLLIAVWLALTACVCRKYQHYIFRIIGEIGIFLTLCLGSARLTMAEMTESGWFMFCALLFVFGCSSFIFHIVIPKTGYEKNAFSHIVRTLVLILLLAVFANGPKGGIGIYAGFAFVSALLLMEIRISYRDVLNDGCLFYCLMSMDALVYCAILCGTFQLKSFLPYYAASILLAGFFEVKQSKNSIFGNILASLIFLWSGWAWLHRGVFYAMLVMLPLFACGFVKKKAAPLYIGLFCIAGIFGAESTVLGILLLWAVPFLCFAVLARIMKDQIFASIGYPLFMVCGAIMFFRLLDKYDTPVREGMILTFLVFAVLHMLLVRLKALAQEGTGFEITAAAMTVFFMICSSFAVYQEYLNILTMVVMAAMFTMNTVHLLKKSENFGYYIGLKYTILMILLVDAHFRISMLISVLMLLFAAGSIAFGFYKKYRSFRIYGLILSMVSVCKLILFDVSGRSALDKAVGFLVCGLICFGISFLYNRIENRVKKREKEDIERSGKIV